MSDAERIARRAEHLARVHAADPGALLCVVGPTASGKTAVAIALAERVGGEIVSADSVQIYRGFDAGSGKPTPEEQGRVPMHLVDAVDPDEAMDASRFAALAETALADVRARGRVPVVCGGTWLWVRALVRGLAPMPPRDEALRAAHRARVLAEGAPALHAELAARDPESARKLHPNDVVRVSRALEVLELGGTPLHRLHAAHASEAPRHRALVFALETPDLDARIAARVDAFLAAGWLDEVRALATGGLRDARAMGSVGYKEVLAHLDGALPASELRDAIVRATRVFARKQRTWLRSESVTWLA